MRQPRDDLHEGGEVVEVDALRGDLDQELDEFRPVARVTLTGNAPHEEQRHLWAWFGVRVNFYPGFKFFNLKI